MGVKYYYQSFLVYKIIFWQYSYILKLPFFIGLLCLLAPRDVYLLFEILCNWSAVEVYIKLVLRCEHLYFNIKRDIGIVWL